MVFLSGARNRSRLLRHLVPLALIVTLPAPQTWNRQSASHECGCANGVCCSHRKAAPAAEDCHGHQDAPQIRCHHPQDEFALLASGDGLLPAPIAVVTPSQAIDLVLATPERPLDGFDNAPAPPPKHSSR